MPQDAANEITLRDYLRVLFRHKAVILTVIVTVTATTWLGLELKTPVYEAQVKMLISVEKREQSAGALTQSEIVKSNPVLDRTVKALKLDQRPLDYEKKFAAPLKAHLIDFQAGRRRDALVQRPPEQQQMILFRRAVEKLKRQVTVQPIRSTNLFTISARDFSSAGAARIANTVSRSYVMYDLEQQLAEIQLNYGEKHQVVKQLQDNIAQMAKGLHGGPLPDIEAIGPASVKIVEQAANPLHPIGSSQRSVMPLAGAFSLGLAVILAFLMDYLDQTLKSPHEVKTCLNLPFLGSIPQRGFWDRPLIERAKTARRPYVRFYERLGDRLYLLAKEQGVKSILLTAARSDEGVTTVATNLSLSLANRGGHRVLLIDANLRQPGVRRALRLPEHPGLADVLQRASTFEQAVQQRGPKLSVLAAGDVVENPISLFESPRMGELIKAARAHYDVILVDGASLQQGHDCTLLASWMDSVALVVNEGKTRRQVIKAALAPLEQVKANVLGGILNRRQLVIPRLIYDWI